MGHPQPLCGILIHQYQSQGSKCCFDPLTPLPVTLFLVLAEGSNETSRPKTNETGLNPSDKSEDRKRRGVTWVSSISWLLVLGASLVYQSITERRVAKLELPREDDIFVVSYPKSGERFVLFEQLVYCFEQPTQYATSAYYKYTFFVSFFHTHLLSSFWTSRGHRCRPFPPPGSCLQFLSRITGFSNPTARRFFIERCELTLSSFPQVNLGTRKSPHEFIRVCTWGHSNSRN